MCMAVEVNIMYADEFCQSADFPPKAKFKVFPENKKAKGKT